LNAGLQSAAILLILLYLQSKNTNNRLVSNPGRQETIMSERTDGAILLRFVYQAMRNAGLPAETVLMKAGIGLNQVEARARTPSAAQNAFWQAVASVSDDPHIGLHLGEHLPLYRGQVLEYLFLSSSSFGGRLAPGHGLSAPDQRPASGHAGL
jgi:hypothetical protein